MGLHQRFLCRVCISFFKMAGEYLKSQGIDIDAELARIQSKTPPPPGQLPRTGSVLDSSHVPRPETSQDVELFRNVSLHHKEGGSRWDVTIGRGQVSNIQPHVAERGASGSGPSHVVDGHGALLAPSLCHPHIHLDKAYLLQHPKYAHLQVSSGTFKEAMELTSKAKAEFEEQDLLERGERLIDESVEAGVSHMRAFVEVDAGVEMNCLDAGVKLKRQYESQGKCVVQLCAFAQLPLFTSSPNDEDGEKIRSLMKDAVTKSGIDVIGSTPYVEDSREKQEQNIDWLIDLAIQHDRHVDFHLDYHLDAEQAPMVWHVVKSLKDKEFVKRTTSRTIVLGHCTRLLHFSPEEWKQLAEEIGNLPVSFVGLPTSDFFIHGRTLPITTLVKEHGLNCCIGVNNIGNAFTPAGSSDPLLLASMGTSIYKSGTQEDAELLYECVSTRAKKAIGMDVIRNWAGEREHGDVGLETLVGDKANRLLFGSDVKRDWVTRKTIRDVVYFYDGAKGRRAVLGGQLTKGSL